MPEHRKNGSPANPPQRRVPPAEGATPRTGHPRHLRGSSSPERNLKSHFRACSRETQATEAAGPLAVWSTPCPPPPGAAAPAHLGPIIAEDAHHADRHSFVQTAPQGLAVESEHKGNVLFTGGSNDGVQGVVQSTCPREDTGMTGEARHTGWWEHWLQGLCYTQQHYQLPPTHQPQGTNPSPKTTPSWKGCVYAESAAASPLTVLANITEHSPRLGPRSDGLPCGNCCVLTNTRKGSRRPLAQGSQKQRSLGIYPTSPPLQPEHTRPAPGEAPARAGAQAERETQLRAGCACQVGNPAAVTTTQSITHGASAAAHPASQDTQGRTDSTPDSSQR